MALEVVTSHFSTVLEPIASASFLSSLSIIHGFSKGSARARERRSLPHLAPSVTRVAICVSRVLLDGLQKKKRDCS